MLNVVINTIPKNRRGKNLADNEDLLRLLVTNTLRSAREAFPDSTITIAQSDTTTFSNIDQCSSANCRAIGQQELLSFTERDDAVPTIYINPLDGPVSTLRLQGFEKGLHRQAVMSSAMPIPVNCNPAWLRMLPISDDYICSVPVAPQLPQLIKQSSLSKCSRDMLKKGGVQGSQFLPNLYFLDQVIMFYPGKGTSIRDEIYLPYSIQEDDGVPIFYKLPLFQLGKDVKPTWPQNMNFRPLFQGMEKDLLPHGLDASVIPRMDHA